MCVTVVTVVSSDQAAPRGKVVAGTRLYSSDAPPEKISRYPVPYGKDLPYDIVELMEEVETKVKTSVDVYTFNAAVQKKLIMTSVVFVN